MGAIKESSDELNPSVITTDAFIPRAPAGRTARDYLALAVATCGVGYLPVAPGTWGSVVGVGIYLLWHLTGLKFFSAQTDGVTLGILSLWTALNLGLIVCVTLAGVWASSRAEKLLGRKDPQVVVIDEVAGQLIALLFIPLYVSMQWPLIVAGFLLFRTFDIWKPYPIRRLEALESGLGIMADDVLAGAYAATLVALLTSIYLLL